MYAVSMTSPGGHIGAEHAAEIVGKLVHAQAARAMYTESHPACAGALTALIDALSRGMHEARLATLAIGLSESAASIGSHVVDSALGRELGEGWHRRGVAEVHLSSAVTAQDIGRLLAWFAEPATAAECDRLGSVTDGRIRIVGVAELASRLTTSTGRSPSDWSGVVRRLMSDDAVEDDSDVDESVVQAALESVLDSEQSGEWAEQTSATSGLGGSYRSERARTMIRRGVSRMTDDQIARLIRLDQGLSAASEDRLAALSATFGEQELRRAIAHLSTCGRMPPIETQRLLQRLSGFAAAGGSSSSPEAGGHAEALVQMLKGRADGREYTPEEYALDLDRHAASRPLESTSTAEELKEQWTRPETHMLAMLEQMMSGVSGDGEAVRLLSIVEGRTCGHVDDQMLTRLRSIGATIDGLPEEIRGAVRRRWRTLVTKDEFVESLEERLRDGRVSVDATRWLLRMMPPPRLVRVLAALVSRPEGVRAAKDLIASRGDELESMVRCVQEHPLQAAGLAVVLAGAASDQSVATLCQAILPSLADAPDDAEAMMRVADGRLNPWPADLTIAAMRSAVDSVCMLGIRRGWADPHPRVRAALMDLLAGDHADSMSGERHVRLALYWAALQSKPRAALRELISHNARMLRPAAVKRAARLSRAMLAMGSVPSHAAASGDEHRRRSA